jgi:hypothetical protein
MLITRTSRLVILCGALALPAASAAQTTYRRAELDSASQLRIVLSNGEILRPAKDSDQVGFEQVAISPDHRIVGWVALYPNCCTTYPIPLALVLLRPGGQRTEIANAYPIWRWAFTADGQHVAIRQAPVHGDTPTAYELREIVTGRLIASARADSGGSSVLPAWTRLVTPPKSP